MPLGWGCCAPPAEIEHSALAEQSLERRKASEIARSVMRASPVSLFRPQRALELPEDKLPFGQPRLDADR
jgi:hypothetical protein